jgi:hypothetical protein
MDMLVESNEGIGTVNVEGHKQSGSIKVICCE